MMGVTRTNAIHALNHPLNHPLRKLSSNPSSNSFSKLIFSLQHPHIHSLIVKIRIGVSDTKINAHTVVKGLADAGAAAVTIHGRTMEQRYTKPADWGIISEVGNTFFHGLFLAIPLSLTIPTQPFFHTHKRTHTHSPFNNIFP